MRCLVFHVNRLSSSNCGKSLFLLTFRHVFIIYFTKQVVSLNFIHRLQIHSAGDHSFNQERWYIWPNEFLSITIDHGNSAISWTALYLFFFIRHMCLFISRVLCFTTHHGVELLSGIYKMGIPIRIGFDKGTSACILVLGVGFWAPAN